MMGHKRIADALRDKLDAIPLNPHGGQLWVAFSGGIDSTALLCAAVETLKPGTVTALHVNHKLHRHAGDWVKHCRRIACQLQVGFDAVEIAVRTGNVEGVARRRRLALFSERLTQGDVFATAHHTDDLAESLLWQFFTGRKTVGITELRPLGRGFLWRPFLRIRKEELREYVIARQLDWIEDPSNSDVAYSRNWLRHVALPEIEKQYPGSISRLAQRTMPWIEKSEASPYPLTDASLNTPAIRRWLLYAGVTPRRTMVEEILRQASASSSASMEVRVSPDHAVRRFRRHLHLVPDSVSKPNPDTHARVSVGRDLDTPQGRLTWERRGGLRSGIVCDIRYRDAGESIRYLGKTKLLSKLFQEKDVPAWIRHVIPLLYYEGRLVCVPGLAVDDRYFDQDGWHAKWQSLAC